MVRCFVWCWEQSRDAILYAVCANASHGLKRTNRDKRNAAMTLLKDPKWSAWSDGEIARRCAVTQQFVSKLRSSLTTVMSKPPAVRTYTTKHGTTSTGAAAAVTEFHSPQKRSCPSEFTEPG
jgi:hypothetical protein